MDELQLLVDLHKNNDRQGPGGDDETARAIELARLTATSSPLKIADIGCGTGASTLTLARLLDAEITAVDFLPEFLEILESRAQQAGLRDRIKPLARSMEELPFAPAEFDLIWSEGAIYNIGFERGIREWSRYLKPGGTIAVSEITWLSDTRPPEIQTHWETEYPEIATASTKIGQLERHGYAPIGYFTLPEHCWLDNYFRPMQASFADFLDRNGNSADARAIVAAEEREIALYEAHRASYSYGMYVARKVA